MGSKKLVKKQVFKNVPKTNEEQIIAACKYYENNSSYFNTINETIRYDKNILLVGKVLFMELTAVMDINRYGIISDRHIADNLGIDIKYIPVLFNNLQSFGYITYTELLHSNNVGAIRCFSVHKGVGA